MIHPSILGALDPTKLGGGFLLALLGALCLIAAISGEQIKVSWLAKVPGVKGTAPRLLLGISGAAFLMFGLITSGQVPRWVTAWFPQPRQSFRSEVSDYFDALQRGGLSPDENSAHLDKLSNDATTDDQKCQVYGFYKRYGGGMDYPALLANYLGSDNGKSCVANFDKLKTYLAGRGMTLAQAPPQAFADQVPGIRGIDLTEYNAPVSWADIPSSHIHFVILRATQGRSLTDESFTTSWEAAKRAGFVRGAYHIYVGSSTPQSQVERFLGAARIEPGDLPPILDLEQGFSGGAQSRENVLSWLRLVEQRTRRRPMIYLGDRNVIAGDTRFANYPLWLPQYGATVPQAPRPWSRVAIWQFSAGGKVAGINQFVDLNTFLGNQDEFRQLLGVH